MDSAGRQEVAILLCCASNFRETRVEEVQSRVLSMMRKLRSLLSETPFGGERIVADL
jgi:hypothetical protein